MLPAPDHDRDVDLRGPDLADLVGDALDLLGIGAVVEIAHQGLAGELQQDSVEREPRPRARYSCPTSKRAKRAMRTFSPVLAATSARRSSIVLPS